MLWVDLYEVSHSTVTRRESVGVQAETCNEETTF